jgi:hypothetical protein
MTRLRLNRAAGFLPLLLSGLAFALVIGNVVAGVPPQPDEEATAHTWQLLMAAQFPLIVLFLVTADGRWGRTRLFLGLQLCGIGLACLPVWLAGY